LEVKREVEMRSTRTDDPQTSKVDLAAGLTGRAVDLTSRTTRRAWSVLEPLAGVALRPPLVPGRFHPARWVSAVERDGVARRESLRDELSRRLDVLVPAVLAELLRRARLTEMVLRYVDLDAVVAAVDLDEAASRLDVDAVVRRADLDAVVERVDVDAVVRRADLDAVVERVDVDAVARRLDIDAVLSRIDLTSLVLERVDLDALLEAVLDRMDLVALAEEVIDGVDLPEIIRESTGSMASDTVRGVRMQGIVADEAVGRAVDRLLLRRGRRSPEAAIPAQSDRNTPR
jgi:hypothetical protein